MVRHNADVSREKHAWVVLDSRNDYETLFRASFLVPGAGVTSFYYVFQMRLLSGLQRAVLFRSLYGDHQTHKQMHFLRNQEDKHRDKVMKFFYSFSLIRHDEPFVKQIVDHNADYYSRQYTQPIEKRLALVLRSVFASVPKETVAKITSITQSYCTTGFC